MKISQTNWKILFFIGWIVFWMSMILPMNTSVGGLTDAGRPYPGFLNLFYSIVAILVVSDAFYTQNGWFDALKTIFEAGVGVSNIFMIFSPAILLLNSKYDFYFKNLMMVCAIYIGTIGSILSYHFYPIRYGHYVWCLSFIIVAFGLFAKAKTKNFIP